MKREQAFSEEMVDELQERRNEKALRPLSRRDFFGFLSGRRTLEKSSAAPAMAAAEAAAPAGRRAPGPAMRRIDAEERRIDPGKRRLLQGIGAGLALTSPLGALAGIFSGKPAGAAELKDRQGQEKLVVSNRLPPQFRLSDFKNGIPPAAAAFWTGTCGPEMFRNMQDDKNYWISPMADGSQTVCTSRPQIGRRIKLPNGKWREPRDHVGTDWRTRAGHAGIDTEHRLLAAPCDGTLYAAWQNPGGGLYFTVEDKYGRQTRCMHLNDFVPDVKQVALAHGIKVGGKHVMATPIMKVSRGQMIGWTGGSGGGYTIDKKTKKTKLAEWAPHLHLDIRGPRGGRYTDSGVISALAMLSYDPYNYFMVTPKMEDCIGIFKGNAESRDRVDRYMRNLMNCNPNGDKTRLSSQNLKIIYSKYAMNSLADEFPQVFLKLADDYKISLDPLRRQQLEAAAAARPEGYYKTVPHEEMKEKPNFQCASARASNPEFERAMQLDPNANPNAMPYDQDDGSEYRHGGAEAERRRLEEMRGQYKAGKLELNVEEKGAKWTQGRNPSDQYDELWEDGARQGSFNPNYKITYSGKDLGMPLLDLNFGADAGAKIQNRPGDFLAQLARQTLDGAAEAAAPGMTA